VIGEDADITALDAGASFVVEAPSVLEGELVVIACVMKKGLAFG